MQNKKVVLISIFSLLLVFIGGFYAYKNNELAKYETMAKEKAALYERPYSYSIGPKDAKVTLVEFFDPACGTCAQFHPYVKEIMAENKNDIRLVLRYAAFHKNSNYAVKMLEGSREQGKFAETLEFMFKTQRYWIDGHSVNPQKLWTMLEKTGLDMEKLSKAMENPKYDEIVRQDLADAEALGATKTPSYFVNGKPLVSFGLDQLKELIKEAL
ncbi:MAG: thioredoxin domain-containing protein [Campylobacteraceae bacterium]|nr:thioredoxin domain-containing protein [Campylobacteraceae bacterium]